MGDEKSEKLSETQDSSKKPGRDRACRNTTCRNGIENKVGKAIIILKEGEKARQGNCLKTTFKSGDNLKDHVRESARQIPLVGSNPGETRDAK